MWTSRLSATTLFGGKYVVVYFAGKPDARNGSRPHTVIDATHVTTEINTFVPDDHVRSPRKVDPVKLKPHPERRAADAFERVGRTSSASRFVNGNAILDDVNSADADHPPRHSTVGDAWRHLRRRRQPDLFDFLNNAVTTAPQPSTPTRKDLDAALLAATGLRQYRRRHLQPGRAVPGTWRRRSGAQRPSC